MSAEAPMSKEAEEAENAREQVSKTSMVHHEDCTYRNESPMIVGHYQ
jgi:hypothetical protein